MYLFVLLRYLKQHNFDHTPCHKPGSLFHNLNMLCNKRMRGTIVAKDFGSRCSFPGGLPQVVQNDNTILKKSARR
jgi:hypothetical protein